MRRTSPVALSDRRFAMNALDTAFSQRRSSDAPSSISVCSAFIRFVSVLTRTPSGCHRTRPPFRPLALPHYNRRNFLRPFSRQRLVRPLLTAIVGRQPLRTAHSQIDFDSFVFRPSGSRHAQSQHTTGRELGKPGDLIPAFYPREHLALPGYSSTTFNA